MNAASLVMPDEALRAGLVGRGERDLSAHTLLAGVGTAIDPADDGEGTRVKIVDVSKESFIDVGFAVGQRLVEAQGGRLRLRDGRHDLGFVVTFPVTR